MEDNEHSVIIQIEDSAPRVSDHDLQKIFARFYRVDDYRDRISRGAGLGLALCKTIIEEHDGTITASHSDLGGVAMTIILPKSGESMCKCQPR